MLRARFWKRCKKTICKLFRALRGGRCSALRCCLSKGVFSFRREYPLLNPQRKARGVPPRPPTLLALCLKDCTRCAVQVQCTWLRHGLLRLRYHAQPRALRSARMTVVRRQTAHRHYIRRKATADAVVLSFVSAAEKIIHGSTVEIGQSDQNLRRYVVFASFILRVARLRHTKHLCKRSLRHIVIFPQVSQSWIHLLHPRKTIKQARS